MSLAVWLCPHCDEFEAVFLPGSRRTAAAVREHLDSCHPGWTEDDLRRGLPVEQP